MPIRRERHFFDRFGTTPAVLAQVRGASVANIDRKRRAHGDEDGREGQRARAVADGVPPGNDSEEVNSSASLPSPACRALDNDLACSPHVHKKAREQLETRTHRRLIQIRAGQKKRGAWGEGSRAARRCGVGRAGGCVYVCVCVCVCVSVSVCVCVCVCVCIGILESLGFLSDLPALQRSLTTAFHQLFGVSSVANAFNARVKETCYMSKRDLLYE